MSDEPKQFLRRQEVINRYPISLSTLAKWQREGTLPYSRVGRVVLFRVSDIEAMIEKGKAVAP